MAVLRDARWDYGVYWKSCSLVSSRVEEGVRGKSFFSFFILSF